MTHVRLRLEELSLQISGSAEREPTSTALEVPSNFVQMLLEQHHATITESSNRRHSEVDERLGRVEALLQFQTTQMHALQVSQVGHLYSTSAPPARRRSVRPVSPDSASRIRANSTSVAIRLRQARTTCLSTCQCSCHAVRNRKTPSFMDRMLGQLFVGYSGLPLLSARCDSAACVRGQVPSVNLEYWFPLGFCWSQIVRLHLAYEANVGPSLQLSTLRRVSDASPCVSFALNGNIDGLRSLFAHGMASPRDVSSTRGYSLLRVSQVRFWLAR